MNLVVILVRTEGALNVGSVARLCGNFGVPLRLVGALVDVRSHEALKMAGPSGDVLSHVEHFGSLNEALFDVELSLATSSKIAEAVDGPPLDLTRARALVTSGRLALVFGNERTGLSKREAALCARVIRLPVQGSMNLSQAVGCALTVFALALNENSETRATPSSREALIASWALALRKCGFYRVTAEEDFAPRLQEIVAKMDVSERDIQILRSMFALFAKR